MGLARPPGAGPRSASSLSPRPAAVSPPRDARPASALLWRRHLGRPHPPAHRRPARQRYPRGVPVAPRRRDRTHSSRPARPPAPPLASGAQYVVRRCDSVPDRRTVQRLRDLLHAKRLPHHGVSVPARAGGTPPRQRVDLEPTPGRASAHWALLLGRLLLPHVPPARRPGNDELLGVSDERHPEHRCDDGTAARAPPTGGLRPPPVLFGRPVRNRPSLRRAHHLLRPTLDSAGAARPRAYWGVPRRRPGGGRLRQERASRAWFWTGDGDDPFHYAPTDTVHCFTAIYAPTAFQADITHRWQRYVPSRDAWVDTDRIAYQVVSGRRSGYRGVTYKQHVSPGRWRVTVETEAGRPIGRTHFTVVAEDPARTPAFTTHRYP
nr:DUF2914 domain-containing protein [Salinibacter ruber]